MTDSVGGAVPFDQADLDPTHRLADRVDAAVPFDQAELDRALEEARRLGFFGPRPVAEQLTHARALLQLIEEAEIVASPFLDLGSGGGLPGLALAAVWTDAGGGLLDASARRCAFLRETVRSLGWADRIVVFEGRGETLARRPELRASSPLVVARSFASPAVTAEIGGALVSPHGVLVVSEPETDADRWPSEGLARLGLAVGDRRRTEGAGIVVLRRIEPLDDAWPRGNGVPAKRPLW
ncbi:MAG TPA: RsmG family class I SAM-dependent methyltransferase [Acidimicrobiia bacterium]|nr:RsmG family class I SAM-dependent methyltransferase [Acidimicrobiia bacterium]